MDYEKKYNEALKDVRAIYPNLKGDAKLAVEHAFPELRESEDERIRKWIVNLLHELHYNQTAQPMALKAIEWLERQKEPHYTKRNALFDKCVAECDPEIMQKVSDEIDEMLEKEQNKCPEFCSGHCIGCERNEQKPNSTEDMPYITDEHFYEREPVDSFKYKLAEYMTRCCTKKEGPYGYEYGISAESILKMAEEELLKRGVVQKPAEWSEEDEKMRVNILNALTPQLVYSVGKGTYTGTSTYKYDDEIKWLKSLRPYWKPSEAQMKALRMAVNKLAKTDVADSVRLSIMYDHLKKLKGGVAPMREIDE